MAKSVLTYAEAAALWGQSVDIAPNLVHPNPAGVSKAPDVEQTNFERLLIMLATGAPLVDDPNYAPPIVFFEDFITTTSSKAAGNGKFAVAADTTEWFVTEVDGATGQTETIIGFTQDIGTVPAARGGWGQFRTCNANNDALSAQLNGEVFSLSAGKPLFFEARVIITDVDKVEFAIGLSVSTTDGYGAVGVGSTDHVAFIMDADGNIDCSVAENSTATKADTTANIVDGSIATVATANVAKRLGFHWDGVDTIKFYVDGVLTNTVTDDGATALIPDADGLSPFFTILSNTTASAVLFIDYIRVVQAR